MKISKRSKGAAALLSGGLLLGSGDCVPDDFWSGLSGSLVESAAVQVLGDTIDKALNPPGPLEVDVDNADEEPFDVFQNN